MKAEKHLQLNNAGRGSLHSSEGSLCELTNNVEVTNNALQYLHVMEIVHVCRAVTKIVKLPHPFASGRCTPGYRHLIESNEN